MNGMICTIYNEDVGEALVDKSFTLEFVLMQARLVL